MDNKETAWAPSVSLPLRTTGRPRLDRADCHQTVAATALPVPMTSLPSLPAAAPLSSTASGGYKGSPPHHGAPFFLPPPPLHHSCAAPTTAIPTAAEPPRTTRSSLSWTEASLGPIRPRSEHHATEYDLATPRATDHHTQMPTPHRCSPPADHTLLWSSFFQ
jgi:hypothetical protein